MLEPKERVDALERLPANEGDSSLILTTDKQSYQPGNVSGEPRSFLEGRMQAGNYSVSVTDATRVVPREVSPSILSIYPMSPPDGRGDEDPIYD